MSFRDGKNAEKAWEEKVKELIERISILGRSRHEKASAANEGVYSKISMVEPPPSLSSK